MYLLLCMTKLQILSVHNLTLNFFRVTTIYIGTWECGELKDERTFLDLIAHHLHLCFLEFVYLKAGLRAQQLCTWTAVDHAMFSNVEQVFLSKSVPVYINAQTLYFSVRKTKGTCNLFVDSHLSRCIIHFLHKHLQFTFFSCLEY